MTKKKNHPMFQGSRIKGNAWIFPFLIMWKDSLELLFADTANSLTGLKKLGAGF